jgi:lipoyl(octanoyl) transferase
MYTTQLLNLGTVNYREAWEQQKTLMEKLKTERRKGIDGINYLLLVEHPHVYTLGRNGAKENMLINAMQLREKQAEFFHVDRGGDITYHGFGQLVVYPIIRLDTFEIGVKEYIFRLEEVVIKTILHYRLQGERLDGATGVWLDAHSADARKICAIGVHFSGFVTMHGFALNVNTDLEYFNYINPCGFVDKGVTSIEKELKSKVGFEEVKKLVVRYFTDVFNMDFV